MAYFFGKIYKVGENIEKSVSQNVLKTKSWNFQHMIKVAKTNSCIYVGLNTYIAQIHAIKNPLQNQESFEAESWYIV